MGASLPPKPLQPIPLGAATLMEWHKSRDYDDLARLEGSEFFPVVFESTGAIGKSATRVLELISSYPLRHEFSNASPDAVIKFLIRSIAILIQRGNALTMQQGLLHAKLYVRPPFPAGMNLQPVIRTH